MRLRSEDDCAPEALAIPESTRHRLQPLISRVNRACRGFISPASLGSGSHGGSRHALQRGSNFSNRGAEVVVAIRGWQSAKRGPKVTPLAWGHHMSF